MAYAPRIVNQSTTYHDEVRARLGTDTGIIPDTDIDALSVLPIAEAKVIARVSDYQSLTSDDLNYLYAATISMLAAILAPSMRSRVKIQEGDSDYKYTKSDIDWVARGIEIEDEAYSIIDLISTQTIIDMPQIGVAGPTALQQQQTLATYGTTLTSPDDGDINLYPTNME